MAILKTTAALSLAVLISFGASACTSSSPEQPTSSSSSSSSSSAEVVTGAMPEEAQKTLNEIHAISKTPEYASFVQALSQSPEDGSGVDKIVADNKAVIDRINKVVSFDEETLKSYKEGATAEGAPKIKPETIDGLASLTAFSVLGQTGNDKVESYGLTSKAITESDGVTMVNNSELYLKDKNSGVLAFGDTLFAKITLEDGGKKIILSKPEEDAKPAEPGPDASAFAAYQKAFVESKPADTKAFIEFLNGDSFESEATFEATEKDGTEYVKVTNLKGNLPEGEILFSIPAAAPASLPGAPAPSEIPAPTPAP